MKTCYGEDEVVAAWVAARIPQGCNFRPGEYHAIGVIDDTGEGVAGIVYHNYYPQYNHIEITMASTTPRWAQRDVIRELLGYPFEQMKCERVTLLVPHTSKRVLRFAQGIGFVHEGTARRAYGDKHAAVLGMLRKEYVRLLSRLSNKRSNVHALLAG